LKNHKWVLVISALSTFPPPKVSFLTQRTETAQYLQEQKSKEIGLVAVSKQPKRFEINKFF